MSKIIVNNLSPDTGISTITVAGNVEATKFVGAVEGSTGTFSSNVTIDGNLGVAGTITYEDVARVDATGISTFREGFGVGPLAGIALTAYKDGSIRTSGIITASSFSGTVASSNLSGALPALDGSSLTGINTAFGNSSVNTTGIITATAFIPSAGQLSHRNLIINGEMQVAQYGTAEVTVADDTNTYRADRFKFAENSSGSAAMSVQNGTGEFSKCVKVRVLSTDTNVYSNDRATLGYTIEDLDAKHLQWGTANAKTVTLSFWVRSNVAGQTFCINVFNSGTNNRTYIAEYTLPGGTANTWQKKTLTIPGDTTGTWAHIGIRWVLMAGSGYQASTGWQAWSGSGGLEMATSNQYNWMGDSNDFHLTGVQLEVGSVATPFEHKNYGDELRRCQRYYAIYHPTTQERIYIEGTAANHRWWEHPIPPGMRGEPTVTKGGTCDTNNISMAGSFTINGLSLTGVDNGGASGTTHPGSMGKVSWRVSTTSTGGTQYTVRHTDGWGNGNGWIMMQSEI